MQIGLSLAADLALFAYGSCFTMSSVVLPQLEDASNTSDLTITSEEGSWFGNDLVIHNYIDNTYFHNTVYNTIHYILNCFNMYLFTASIFVIGSISGALVGGITGEKLGRKSALMIDNLIMIVGKIKIISIKVHKGK